MRLLLALPLLGGCWLGNDFSRFEHADGGELVVNDLATTDQSAASDGGLITDGAANSDGGDAAVPSGACPTELGWKISTPPMMGVAGATLVSVPVAGGGFRMFLVGGCTALTGTECSVYSDAAWELTSAENGTALFTPLTPMSAAPLGQYKAAGAAYPPPPKVGAPANPLFLLAGSLGNDEELDAFVEPTSFALADQPPFSSTDKGANSGVAATTFASTVWVAGGFPDGDVYSLASFDAPTWEKAPGNLITPRAGTAMAPFAGAGTPMLWVIGGIGMGTSAAPLRTVEISTNPQGAHPWSHDSTAHDLATARYGHAAVSAPDGRIYVIGGQSAPLTAIATVEVTCGDTFHTMDLSLLTTPITDVSAAIGPDNRIYAIGRDPSSNATAPLPVVMYAYGPTLGLDKGTLTGKGFASKASYTITFGGNMITGTTSMGGEISAVVTDGNVSPTPGTVFIVTDEQSRYPARLVAP